MALVTAIVCDDDDEPPPDAKPPPAAQEDRSLVGRLFRTLGIVRLFLRHTRTGARAHTHTHKPTNTCAHHTRRVFADIECRKSHDRVP